MHRPLSTNPPSARRPASAMTLSALLALCAASRAQSGFETQFYRSLDIAAAAREQYGSTAGVTSVGQHLYDWRAVVGASLRALDLKRAVHKQYGSDWTLVSLGVHLYDWKAVRYADLESVVLPVMLIATDRFYDVTGVREGVTRFSSVLTCVQNWYRLQVGSTFRLLQPVVIPTARTSAQWNQLSFLSSELPHRFALLNAAVDEYNTHLPPPGSALRVQLSPYVGNFPDVYLGAAAVGRFALAPQRATSIQSPPSGPLDYRSADAAYAVGHELGHTFGLGHACDDFPQYGQCSRSIMQTGKPWDAILLEPEIVKLLKTEFFLGSSLSYGASCPGSYGLPVHAVLGPPAIGQTQTYRLGNGPRLAPAIHILGWSNQFFGPFPLPLDLTLFGAPGCRLYNDAAVTFGLTTDSSGVAAMTLTHPNNANLIGLRVFTQFAALDRGANALGVVYTNGVATRLGR